MPGGEAHVRIRMKDFRPGKPLFSEHRQLFPQDPAFLAAPLKNSQPAFAHFASKALEANRVSGYRVVVEVALYHASQPFPDLRQRLMHAHPELVFYLLLGKESLSELLRSTRNLPFFLACPQMWVKPRKLNVCGLPPRASSDLLRQNARIQSGAFYPDVVPARTPADVPSIPEEIAPHRLDTGNPEHYRPHNGPR
jgi:hypothetical protein